MQQLQNKHKYIHSQKVGTERVGRWKLLQNIKTPNNIISTSKYMNKPNKKQMSMNIIFTCNFYHSFVCESLIASKQLSKRHSIKTLTNIHVCYLSLSLSLLSYTCCIFYTIRFATILTLFLFLFTSSCSLCWWTTAIRFIICFNIAIIIFITFINKL